MKKLLSHAQYSKETQRKNIKKYNLPLCSDFIDYEKAFGSVYTSAVLKSLEDIGIDKTHINIIMKIYMKATTIIRLDRGKGS